MGRKKLGEWRVCSWCGINEFYVPKFRLDKGDGKTCSYKCRERYRRDRERHQRVHRFIPWTGYFDDVRLQEWLV